MEAAAKSGNIDLLYQLIHQDPYLLVKIDNVPFVDTPLHLAAVAGKTEFAIEMMNLKPSFAHKLNAHGLTPLHLAVNHGHFWLVLEIVKVDPSLVRIKGRQGMTPLLFAVSRKKMDLISEFFLVCPGSIVDSNVNGENSLHIAVKNNDQREGLLVLKVLMGWILRLCQKDADCIETRVINRRDRDGNTALHLAAYEKNLQAMKLMLKSSKININIENNNGLTVLDIALLETQYNNREEIETLIKRHGGKHSVSLVKVKTTSDLLGSRLTWKESRRTSIIRSYSSIPEERRNAILVVTTLIITATYQTVLQPPGGVSDGGGSSDGTSDQKAGSVVMEESLFILLWLWNTTGFNIATGLTLGLLSLGQTNMFWYYSLFVPLILAYALSGQVISPTTSASAMGYVGSVVALIIWGSVVRFWEWVQSKRAKVPEPKSGLVWEGFTTMDQARGIASDGYLIM